MGQEQLHIVLMRIRDFDWKTMGDWFQELGLLIIILVNNIVLKMRYFINNHT